MKIEVWFLVSTMVSAGIYLLWSAYQIHFESRIDLVTFGSRPLLGADILKRQFVNLFVLRSAACALSVLVLVITKTIFPAIWLFFGLFGALAVRQYLLVRAVEIHTKNVASE